MHPFEVATKQILLKGEITAEEYNAYIVAGVANKIIKDITPPIYSMEKDKVVEAVVELSDGSQFRIEIWNPPNLLNPDKKLYKSEVKQVDNRFSVN